MKISLRSAIAFATVCLPAIAMAAAPGNVRDIRAEAVSDGVQVTWTKVAGDVASYRIFYSHASILENDGLYDDYESAPGDASSYVLKNIARGGEIFVSVLAVNAMGEESPLFLEEASVTIEAASMPPASSVSSTVMQPLAANELRLLSAEAISATGVILTFSHPVDVPMAEAATAIMIKNASGGSLPLKRLIVQGNTVEVHTLPQERNTVYRVTIGRNVTGKTANGTIMLAADQAPMIFAGHQTGIAPGAYNPTSAASSSMPSANKPEAVSLQMRAEPETGGTYTVEATWQSPGTGVQGYLVSQTRNKGVTYGQAASVPAGSTSVKVRGVPAGDFGMLVKTVYADGTTTRGVAQTINLPGTQTRSSSSKTTVTASVTGKDVGSLPSSGPALWVLAAAAGGMAGYWNVRGKRMTNGA